MQTLGFMFFNARFLDWARRRYGDAVTFRSLFDSAFVIVFSPELVKQVFRAPPDRLRAGEANALLGPIVGERSVLLLDGREHMRQRKLLLPPFHGERMRAYEQVMVEATDRVLDGWRAGDEVTLLPAMQAVTLEVIERAVFGVEDDRRREELSRRVRALLDPVNSRGQVLMLVLTGGRRGAGAGEDFVRARRELDELLFDEIARRRAEPDLAEREDVLSMLLGAADEHGEPMTDGELRDELLTLLVAGHETTATALAWAFELLMRNPDARRTETDADLDAVVKETLRIRPVISGRGPRDPRRAVRAGRPHAAGGDGDQPVDRRDPPPRRPLPRPGRLRPRPLPRRGRAGHLHVAAVRRRHAPLPGRQLRHVRDAHGDPARARAGGHGARRPAREGRAAKHRLRAGQGCAGPGHARSNAIPAACSRLIRGSPMAWAVVTWPAVSGRSSKARQRADSASILAVSP